MASARGVMASAPSRADGPTTSRTSAPAAARRRPVATAASGSNGPPPFGSPPEVTSITPMIMGRVSGTPPGARRGAASRAI